MRVDTSNNKFNKEAVAGGEDTEESPLHIFLGSVNCGWIVGCEVVGCVMGWRWSWLRA